MRPVEKKIKFVDFPEDEESTTKKKSSKGVQKKKEHALNGSTERKQNLISRYNDLDAKSNANHALIKTVVDVIAGAMIGPALSATLGKFAPIAGAALTFGGHYTGDQTGLMRGIGMSTLAHSVAKTNEYRQSDSTLKNRLSELKDDWLRLILLKKADKPKTELDGMATPDELKQVIQQEMAKEQPSEKESDEQLETVQQRQRKEEKLDQFNTNPWDFLDSFNEPFDPIAPEKENWDDIDFSQF